MPETTQGRAPKSDLASGRYAKGYSCNAVQISKSGTTGGYRVERYVDKAGHECAYADTTLLFPQNAPDQGTTGTGTSASRSSPTSRRRSGACGMSPSSTH